MSSSPDIRDLMQGSIPDIYLTEDSLRWVMEFRRLFEGPVAELAAQRAQRNNSSRWTFCIRE